MHRGAIDGRTGPVGDHPRQSTPDHDRRPGRSAPADLVGRRLGPPTPNRLWVADLTYVSTWSGLPTSPSSPTPTRGASWAGGSPPRWPPAWCSTRSSRPSGPANNRAFWISKMLSTIRIGDRSLPRSGSPNASPRQESSPRSERSAAPMDVPRHMCTMSRDITLVELRGFEPVPLTAGILSDLQVRSISFRFVPVHHQRFHSRVLTASRPVHSGMPTFSTQSS